MIDPSQPAALPATPPPGVPPLAGSAAATDDLRADLRDAEFTVPALEQLLGPVAARALHREQALPALRATRGSGSPAATLLQLFVLGAEVPRSAVDAALPRTGTDGAVRLGLVTTAGAGPDDPVRTLVDLRPYQVTDAGGSVSWWVASDLGELATGRPLRTDHVLGVGGASTTLAQVTIRSPRERTLDLGTGCGIQALHAARHSGHVVGTDVSARALAFAAFNAGLAGERIELRRGSLLDPVADERFDLVVSNPPFVITPRAGGTPGDRDRPGGPGVPRFEYRDAGAHGDDVVRDLVTRVGQVLAPGGVAQLLGNWEHHTGQDWQERVGRWLDDSGLDGWVIQREVQDPAEYAETWLRDGGTTPERDPDGWRAGYTAWLADFEARGVEAVGFGIVTLRRPDAAGPRLRRMEEHAGPLHQPLGDHLARALAAHDWLAERDDVTLAAACLRRAPDVTEERFHTPGEPHPAVILLRQGTGLGRAVQVGTTTAALVGACDGELTVGQLAAGIGALLDRSAAEILGEVLPVLRPLVRDAFLEPV